MVLDLFSGCGGLSLGFKTAGFKIAGHLESDKDAYRSATLNVPPELDFDGQFDIKELQRNHDIIDQSAGLIDVLIGGPPCQAYSIVGRSKLASLNGSKNAHLEDSRGKLYLDFLRIAEFLKPKAILIENVPAILSYGDSLLPEKISENLVSMGYSCNYTILNAASYGVPQYRDRIFILAIRKDLNCPPTFPNPTHKIPEIRKLGKKQIVNLTQLKKIKYAIEPPNDSNPHLPKAITVAEALSDLPFISTVSGDSWKFRLDKSLPYSSHPTNSYSRMLRNWPEMPIPVNVNCNTCRDTPRDFPIFQKMNQGDTYPEALEIAQEILEERISSYKTIHGCSPDKETLREMEKRTVPPYDPEKFKTKWRKLSESSPSHTVIAHLSSDTYSHIHYDSAQARGITPREAARLQSFPDSFRFIGNLESVFRQIGNAVPPLLAFHLAKSINNCLS